MHCLDFFGDIAESNGDKELSAAQGLSFAKPRILIDVACDLKSQEDVFVIYVTPQSQGAEKPPLPGYAGSGKPEYLNRIHIKTVASDADVAKFLTQLAIQFQPPASKKVCIVLDQLESLCRHHGSFEDVVDSVARNLGLACTVCDQIEESHDVVCDLVVHFASDTSRFRGAVLKAADYAFSLRLAAERLQGAESLASAKLILHGNTAAPLVRCVYSLGDGTNALRVEDLAVAETMDVQA